MSLWHETERYAPQHFRQDEEGNVEQLTYGGLKIDTVMSTLHVLDRRILGAKREEMVEGGMDERGERRKRLKKGEWARHLLCDWRGQSCRAVW